MFSFKSSLKSSSSGNQLSTPRFTEESDVQEQLNKLQEELVKEKEEKVRALDEIEELKKKRKEEEEDVDQAL